MSPIGLSSQNDARAEINNINLGVPEPSSTIVLSVHHNLAKGP